MDTAALIAANQRRWDVAQYNEHAKSLAHHVAQRLCAEKAKAVYLAIEHDTGVPWFAVAMIHEREASQSWQANIAQGDPFSRRSVHVPKGRGPFRTFFEAAHDALVNCPPHAARWHDWSMGGLLTILEMYNGMGYENFHHMASPYIWAGSNQYTRGKYIADNHFDPNAVDTQLGCAVILHAMAELDPSIKLGPVVPVAAPVAENEPPTIDDTTYPPEPIAANYEPEQPNEPPAAVGRQIPDWMRDMAVSKAQDVAYGTDIKSLFRSRIGWGTVGLASSGTLTTAAAAPASVADNLLKAVQSPFFWVMTLNIALAIFVLYRYWKDHGKGSV